MDLSEPMRSALQNEYRSARDNRYFIYGSLTVLFLEFVQMFPLEMHHIWPIPWTPVKMLYVTNRYFPFIAVAMLAAYHSVPRGFSPKACQILFSVPSLAITFSIFAAEILIYIRIYALSGCQRSMRMFLTAHMFTMVIVCISSYAVYLSRHTWFGGPEYFSSCISLTLGTGPLMVVYYVVLLYNSLFTAGLSLWLVLRIHWMTPKSHLLSALYQDGALYFVAIALMSILNTIYAISSRTFVVVPQGVAHNVLAVRMVLHLRETALRDMGFTVDAGSRLGRLSFAPPPSDSVDLYTSRENKTNLSK
ncbi:hypothetical protein BKA70DRAFT_114784 [Coprinopsis sp. MPI-PUGE-AT-0042]|nr:hypothetical protein BKA70DRAFT_114784 [Coprinopsis sp. MPI-PUGE-AT-0042]